MLWWLLLILVVSVGLLLYLRASANRRQARELADARDDARVTIERLGGQVYQLSPTNDASRQALADASERYNAAGGQIDRADSVHQALLAKQTALEGLYYIRAARVAMDMDPGPPIPSLDGQRIAGEVEQPRVVEHNGRRIAASPTPSNSTPNYFPGGRVAGRPVPAGWYSEPWWKPALIAGAWGVGSALLFSTLFNGMPGVPYDAQAFEDGSGEASLDTGGDTAWGDPGYDGGYDAGAGGFDGGGGDFGSF
ncbi:DUF1542 domain-containing protein [Nocardia camponoti]|uniref:DUF1542 domain-containing protein n=1 Tax=Nocardia camponoti TaxID=1616106 RepID=A0A917VB80_9NOCA|nr:DUF1542 domain-containing protein [Nocardia camponoti]GGK58125.1 hypothetical protein GCM10011591_32900 [Nocardia camponoti]